MKRLALAGLLVLFTVYDINAWDINQAKGGRTNSLGKCSVALSDFWSLHNNPAGFASYKEIGFGISYENRFLLKELSNKDAGLLLPSYYGTIGISVSQFGYEHYNENLFGLGFSRNFGPELSIGLKLYYIFVKFSNNYPSSSVPTFDLGMQYHINESLCLGVYVFNPINISIGNSYKNKIPIIMRLGFSFFIIDDFLICGEIEEDFNNDFSFRLGLEYEIYKDIYVRSGFQFKPEVFTFGIGYDYKWFIVDVAAQMSHNLGSSLNCSMTFKIKQISKK